MSDAAAIVAGLPPLREVIAAHGLRAEKALGQNFLLDQNITDKIARHAGDLAGVHVIEIGPGPGGLTRSLLKSAASSVTAIEFDSRAIKALASLQEAFPERLRLIEADALAVDVMALVPAPRAIIANLPYNIATPLLINWLRQIREQPGAFQSLTLMFQKEVAQRIAAASGDKAYGRLAVLTQWLCTAKRVFDVPAAAFTPPPKVTSSIVHLTPLALSADAPDFAAVEAITAAAFGQRRKMIRTTLKGHTAALEAMGVDLTSRAEELPPAVFIELAKTRKPPYNT